MSESIISREAMDMEHGKKRKTDEELDRFAELFRQNPTMETLASLTPEEQKRLIARVERTSEEQCRQLIEDAMPELQKLHAKHTAKKGSRRS